MVNLRITLKIFMDFTTKLISILKIVNDWLKYSEAKNAILLAFSGAGATTVVTYLSTKTDTFTPLYIGLLISIFLFCCSLLICSLSFLPKTNLESILWRKEKPSKKAKRILNDTDNFYFFNDLKKYHSEGLLCSINRLYFENKITLPFRKEDLDIANQIVVNSEITSTKLSFFITALWFSIISIICIPISVIASIIMG